MTKSEDTKFSQWFKRYYAFSNVAMKPLCYKDTELLSRLPVGKWFAAGALSIHASKLNRLVRLGVLKRRYCLDGLRYSRKWDYLRER